MIKLPTRIITLSFLVGGLLMANPGCDATTGIDGLDVVLTLSSSDVSVSDSVTLTVTATNAGSERIVWGHGSSSCQLTAWVRVGLRTVQIDDRACTEDLAPQGLDSGESRTESWKWNAVVFDAGTVDTLPPGGYRLVATAGDAAHSETRLVRVLAANVP